MSDNLAEPTFDTDAARKVLEVEKEERKRRAGRRIEEALKEERCVLIGIPQYTTDGRTVVTIAIDAQD